MRLAEHLCQSDPSSALLIMMIFGYIENTHAVRTRSCFRAASLSDSKPNNGETAKCTATGRTYGSAAELVRSGTNGEGK